MLSREEYIQLSLTYNLFWIRIMKEHAVFIEGAMSPPGKQLAARANRFKQQFDRLLLVAIRLAADSVPKEALQSGQYYTRYTEEAERVTQRDTGIAINSDLTRLMYNIAPLNPHLAVTAKKEQEISALNQNILSLTNALAKLKAEVLGSQTACSLFTFLFDADLEHVLLEARRYIEILRNLQNRDDGVRQDYKKFWIENMAGHAKVMRGLFDPAESNYIEAANQFARTFDSLLQNDLYLTNPAVLTDTKAIGEFKADATRGILECRVKSVMLPLYTDHLLREASHFIYLMQG
ncbi:DUF2935 domain-containing protein [Papillibacter cinnamivorans]|uniref:DUF2935 domain-containing protein n=1 Tax=Papillibacter cinnamivorans DSM 12816 TaxID=1122930 RepID=A0A1W2BE67_9FIRM|nr:DUF2935 domain-containing protein [Papillibacter cinnamivorans]SMC71287.1 protein of unknown function [Papillibacter cinnamivorans DSM 12816]